MAVGLGVPVMVNFKGYTELMQSVNYPVVPLVYNNWDENRGVAIAWNEMLQKAIHEEFDYLILANDDVVCCPDTVLTLVAEMGADSSWDFLSGANHDASSDEPADVDFPDYSFFIIRPRDFRNKFGYFDEGFKKAYFEDNDMAYRIKLAGGRQGVHEGARIYHKGSQTQFWGGGKTVSDEQFEANRAYYMSKWGGQPRNEVFTTPFGEQ